MGNVQHKIMKSVDFCVRSSCEVMLIPLSSSSHHFVKSKCIISHPREVRIEGRMPGMHLGSSRKSERLDLPSVRLTGHIGSLSSLGHDGG